MITKQNLANEVSQSFLAGDFERILTFNLRVTGEKYDERTSYYIVASEINTDHEISIPEDYDYFLGKDCDDRKRNFYLANLLLAKKEYEKCVNLFLKNYQQFKCYISLYNAALVHKKLGAYRKSIDLVQPLLRIEKYFVEANLLLASLYSLTEQGQKAIDHYLKVVQINKKNSLAWYNMAVELEKLNNVKLSLKILRTNVKVNQCAASANKLANYYIASNHLDQAKIFINQALNLEPKNPDYYNNLGNLYQKQRLYKDAATAYQTAITINPLKPEPFYNAANVFRELRKLDLAIKCYDEATLINPDYNEAWAKKIYLKSCISDFSWEADYEIFKTNFKKRGNPPPPLSLTFADDDPKFQRAIADWWMEELPDFISTVGVFEEGGSKRKSLDTKKIKIAYVTGDSSTHAVSRLALELFKSLNRKRFSIVGVFFSKLSENDYQKVKNSFDQIIDLSALSTPERIVSLRNECIDIAFDMCGHTRNACTEVFKARISKKQVNFLGQPGTMGGHSHDYIIADEYVIPRKNKKFFSEKVVYLPASYMPEDWSYKSYNAGMTAEKFGFKNGATIFWALHNSYKISRSLFDCWLKILTRVESGVLWMLESSPEQKNNLRNYAEQNGINPDRLIFTPRLSYDDYMATFKIADLFLDTKTYSSGSTAKDAVKAGIPIISVTGKSYAARMSTSVLQTLKTKQMISKDLRQYEDYAVSWSEKNVNKEGGHIYSNRESARSSYVAAFEVMLGTL